MSAAAAAVETPDTQGRATAALTLAALGVVYGDMARARSTR
jgi:hypothetical protein